MSVELVPRAIEHTDFVQNRCTIVLNDFEAVIRSQPSFVPSIARILVSLYKLEVGLGLSTHHHVHKIVASGQGKYCKLECQSRLGFQRSTLRGAVG